MIKLLAKHVKYPEGAAAEAVKLLERARITAERVAESEREELGEPIAIFDPGQADDAILLLKGKDFEVHLPGVLADYS